MSGPFAGSNVFKGLKLLKNFFSWTGNGLQIMSSTFNNPQGRSHLLGYLGEKVYLVEPIFIVAVSHSCSTFETIFVFDSHSNSNFLVVARIAGRASSTYLDFSSASDKCFTNSSNLDTTTGGIRITFRL